uniref:Uncharacterized protein n=1 Tax=viral metagenome TaxID=1070528 RepID=A0A6M3J154_9ZZZZ
MPLDESYATVLAPARVRSSMPWIASGEQDANAIVKSGPGILGGLVVTATTDAGTANVIIWDSPDADLTDDEVLARVTVTDAVTNHQNSLGAPAYGGIEARLGIYLQIAAGNVLVNVYYQ